MAKEKSKKEKKGKKKDLPKAASNYWWVKAPLHSDIPGEEQSIRVVVLRAKSEKQAIKRARKALTNNPPDNLLIAERLPKYFRKRGVIHTYVLHPAKPTVPAAQG